MNEKKPYLFYIDADGNEVTVGEITAKQLLDHYHFVENGLLVHNEGLEMTLRVPPTANIREGTKLRLAIPMTFKNRRLLHKLTKRRRKHHD